MIQISDEFRQISAIIGHSLRLVDHGDDFETQLQFLTDCRGKFSRLDAVQVQLVHCANALAVATRRRLLRKSSRVTTRGRGFLQVNNHEQMLHK